MTNFISSLIQIHILDEFILCPMEQTKITELSQGCIIVLLGFLTLLLSDDP